MSNFPSFNYDLLKGAKSITEDIRPFCDIYELTLKKPFMGKMKYLAIWLGHYWHTLGGWDFHYGYGEYNADDYIESWKLASERRKEVL